MNHLYNDTTLSLAIVGYFHDTFNFDADYFYDGHKIIWVADFLEKTQKNEDRLFMNILPNVVIMKICAFYRRSDFLQKLTSNLMKIGDNGFLTMEHKQYNNQYSQFSATEERWAHVFGLDVVGRFAKKHWKIKLVENIEQIAIGIIGTNEMQKLLINAQKIEEQFSELSAYQKMVYGGSMSSVLYSDCFLNKKWDGIGIESRWDPNAVNQADPNDWSSYKKFRNKAVSTEFREWTKREAYCDFLKTGDEIEFIVDLSKINDYTMQFIVNGKECDLIPSTMLNCEPASKKYKLAIALKNVYNTDKPTKIQLLQ